MMTPAPFPSLYICLLLLLLAFLSAVSAQQKPMPTPPPAYSADVIYTGPAMGGHAQNVTIYYDSSLNASKMVYHEEQGDWVALTFTHSNYFESYSWSTAGCQHRVEPFPPHPPSNCSTAYNGSSTIHGARCDRWIMVCDGQFQSTLYYSGNAPVMAMYSVNNTLQLVEFFENWIPQPPPAGTFSIPLNCQTTQQADLKRHSPRKLLENVFEHLPVASWS